MLNAPVGINGLNITGYLPVNINSCGGYIDSQVVFEVRTMYIIAFVRTAIRPLESVVTVQNIIFLSLFYLYGAITM